MMSELKPSPDMIGVVKIADGIFIGDGISVKVFYLDQKTGN